MMRSIVAQEHGNGCRGDDDVANPAEDIGNLTEDEIAENCRKDNLAIVIYGNFSGGGVGIGCGDGELTACRRKSCKQENTELLQCHGVIAENEIGQGDNAGKCGEKEHDEGSFYTIHAQGAYTGIGNAGTQAAEQTNQCREACQIGGGRLDDEQRTDKSGNHTKPLKEIDSFL